MENDFGAFVYYDDYCREVNSLQDEVDTQNTEITRLKNAVAKMEMSLLSIYLMMMSPLDGKGQSDAVCMEIARALNERRGGKK